MKPLDLTKWSYGCEHELADWDRSRPLPPNWKVDERDITIVNSNGVAADPKARLYKFGGEVNTPPTRSAAQQCALLSSLKLRGDIAINYRSNLHVHVRVPGLVENLNLLKQVQAFNARWLPELLPLIEPIPEPNAANMTLGDLRSFDAETYLAGAARRFRRCKISHHTVLSAARVEGQLDAESTVQFFEREVPFSKAGKPMWHFQPRAAVNLRQLLQTDTVEFRHWPGTLDTTELLSCVQWCQAYLELAVNAPETNPIKDLLQARKWHFPKFQPYEHWKEVRYRATCHDGTLTDEQITENIKRILNGEL